MGSVPDPKSDVISLLVPTNRNYYAITVNIKLDYSAVNYTVKLCEKLG